MRKTLNACSPCSRTHDLKCSNMTQGVAEVFVILWYAKCSNIQDCTFNAQDCTFSVQDYTFNIQDCAFSVQDCAFNVQDCVFNVQDCACSRLLFGI